MAHSKKCRTDLSTYWDSARGKCVSCPFQRGHNVTPNCGKDDNGGIHEHEHEPCGERTFNDGSAAFCRPCSSCLPPRSIIQKNCTSDTDTICEELGSTSVPDTETTTSQPDTTTLKASASSPDISAAVWAVPVFLILIGLCTFIIFQMKKKRGQCTNMCFKRRRSLINQGFAPISFSASNKDNLEDILNENTMAAPLQIVLDKLDILEELVILLDPETQGIKNTKHLASHCSFPSTWITYTYSMKESKSPLKAVLEGVTSRNPDWTVGHLAKILRQMNRNDAIAVLAKLKPGSQELNV